MTSVPPIPDEHLRQIVDRNEPRDEYERGWQMRGRFIRETSEIVRKSNAGPGVLLFPVGLYVLMFTGAFIVPLVRWGNYHGGFLLLAIAGAVWMIYLWRAEKRAKEAYRVAKAEYDARWRDYRP